MKRNTLFIISMVCIWVPVIPLLGIGAGMILAIWLSPVWVLFGWLEPKFWPDALLACGIVTAILVLGFGLWLYAYIEDSGD